MELLRGISCLLLMTVVYVALILLCLVSCHGITYFVLDLCLCSGSHCTHHMFPGSRPFSPPLAGSDDALGVAYNLWEVEYILLFA